MRKLYSTVLSAILAVTVFSGCTNNDPSTAQKSSEKGGAHLDNLNLSGFPIVNQKITLKMMGSKAPTQGPWDQLDVFTKYEQMSNIHIDWDTPLSSAFNEKKNLAFASGEVPDAFFGADLTPDEEVAYGGQGVLIPLEKLIDQYAPNIKKILDQDPDLRRSITTTDGHIYSLPKINYMPRDSAAAKTWINKKWLDKLGLKLPETTDELYTVLKAFKDNDPNGNGQADEIPVTAYAEGKPKDLDLSPALMQAFGLLGTNIVNVKDGKVFFVPTQPGYKEFLQYMNKLNSDGLLDKESYSQTRQQISAKAKANRLGMFVSAGPHVVVDPKDALDYVALPPLTSAVNKEKMWPKNPQIQRGTFAITSKNKNPEATIRWVDYFYSDEGFVLMGQGEEGKSWKWTDDTKTQWFKNAPPGMSVEEFRAQKATPAAGTTVPYIWRPEFALKQKNPLATHIDEEVAAKYQKYLKDPFPLLYLTSEQEKRISAMETDIFTYLEQMDAKFILGSEPISNWDKYVSTLKGMGADDLVKIYQEAYDKWKSAK